MVKQVRLLTPFPERSMSFKRITLATSLAALSFAAVADEPVPDVVVVAPKGDSGAAAPTEVDAATLRRLLPATSDTASLLRDLPGVSLQGGGGVSSLPSIHGLADDRIRTKVDGMDLISACANHMNSPLSYIDPTQVGQVQVFAGISPVSVGGDSIGGTILVDSPAAEFAAPGAAMLRKGEVGTFYRSNGNAWGANLSATAASDTLSLSYQGATAESENYQAAKAFKPAGPAAAGRGWLDGDEVGSSSYESSNHALAIALQREAHLLELKMGVQDIPHQGWTNQRMDMTDNDSTQFNLRYQGGFDWGLFEARAYDEQTRHDMDFGEDKLYWYGPGNVPGSDGVPGPISGGPNGYAAGMPMDTEGRNTGLVLKGEIALREGDVLRVGGEFQRYRLDDWWEPSGKGMWPETFWNIHDGERDRLAAYGEWEREWDTQWLTQLGLRHEQVEMNAGEVQGYNPMFSPADEAAFNAADRELTDHNWDLTALARFAPSAGERYEFGLAQKSRSPNLYERYAWSTHGMAMRMVNWAGDGNGYVGNLELEPEVAYTLSASADWHDAGGQQWSFKVTPYLTYVEDYIDGVRCDSNPDGSACNDANLTRSDGFVYLRFANQSARLYGIDLSGSVELGEQAGLGRFSATGVLNYVQGENRDTGDDLYNLMPLNARLGLVQAWGGWTNTLEWELVDDKTEVSQVRNEVETGGYGLFNLRSSYQWKQARLDLGIENLFDKYYHHPLGGAYTGQGKTMSGTDVPWGVPVPGPGRSFYAGVTLNF
jgi:iron complex outermembrane recepter protein